MKTKWMEPMKQVLLKECVFKYQISRRSWSKMKKWGTRYHTSVAQEEQEWESDEMFAAFTMPIDSQWGWEPQPNMSHGSVEEQMKEMESSYPQHIDRKKWKCKIDTVNRPLQEIQCLLFHEFNKVLNHSSPLRTMHEKYRDR